MKNRVREMRLEKGLSQKELANPLGYVQPTIAAIERGQTALNIKQMAEISKALDCEPYELLPLEWQPQPLTEEEKQLLALFRKKTGNNEK